MVHILLKRSGFSGKADEMGRRETCPTMAKIGTQRHLLAIRNGVVSTLSLILIGTFFMVFINLPFPGWNEFIAPLFLQRLFYLLG